MGPGKLCQNPTREPILDTVDARRRSLWIRTVRTSWCTQSGCWWCALSFRFGGKLYLDKFSGHLHEVKQAETVHHKLLLFITTQLDVLVQPAPLRFPATAEFALVFALPCRAIPCWEPGAYFAESSHVLDNTSVFAPDPQLLLSLLVLGSRP